MPSFKNIFLKLFCAVICLIATVNITAQICSGSWALQRPVTIQCVTGQWVGWQNSGNPLGCPINPVYVGVQINTFTFSNSVSTFSIDLRSFDGMVNCPRIELKINGVFYPLTASNLTDFPAGSTCTTGSFSYMAITADGYLTVSSLGGSGFAGQGRITITNVNATSISVSTNDGNGTVFSDPFNCTTVPLKLISFKGQNSLCKAQLNWKTGIEQNIKNTEIERSEDGILFRKVGNVNPKGSNSQYLFVTANSTNAYFRLKFNDLDGYYEYSEIIFLKSSCNEKTYAVFTNPASGEIEIIGLKKNDQIIITDIQGKIVSRINSVQNNKLNIQFLPQGMYIFQVFNNGVFKVGLKVIKN